MLNNKKLMALTLAGTLGLSVTTTALAASNRLAAGKGQSAKNVIVMIADGWGENQILAANYYNSGKTRSEAYQYFPTKTFMSTYSLGAYDPAAAWSDPDYINTKPTDSAAAGTAMSTGVKTYDAAIGVDAEKNSVKHIGEYFEEAGRATGVVSSVQYYHATPAAFVAHNVSRNDYYGIASEMIRDSATDVIMGAGHPGYNDSNLAVDSKYLKGDVALWDELVSGTAGADADGDGIADPWTFIETKEDFEALTEGATPERVFGVAQVGSTLQQGRSGDKNGDAYAVPFNTDVPDLATMSRAALNVLDNDEDGLFLMIEGGAIDWAGHANQLGRNIEERNDFNAAVDAVIDWVETESSWSETLLIVTGDHETGYLSGSDAGLTCIVNNGAGEMPAVVWNSGNHTNQLIPLYAKGQGASLLTRQADVVDSVRGRYMDNTEIFPVVLDLLK